MRGGDRLITSELAQVSGSEEDRPAEKPQTQTSDLLES